MQAIAGQKFKMKMEFWKSINHLIKSIKMQLDLNVLCTVVPIMSKLIMSMCWQPLKVGKGKLNGVSAAVYRKQLFGGVMSVELRLILHPAKNLISQSTMVRSAYL